MLLALNKKIYNRANIRLPTGLVVVTILITTLLSTRLSFAESAPNRVYSFNLPEQSLSLSLTELARLTRIQILYRSDIAESKIALPLKGDYPLHQAVHALLKNTELVEEFVRADLLVIRQRAAVKDDTRVIVSKPVEENYLEPDTIIEILVVGETHKLSCCSNSPSTASKTYVSTLELPRSIEGITAELFNDRGDILLSEAFSDYTSVLVTDAQGNINLRGFNLPDSAILKDGHSIVNHGILSLPLQNIEGIEVAKGANSTLYGNGEPGGVINLITKKPSANPFTTLSVNYGNYDDYVAIDTNSPAEFNPDFWRRFNFIYREEKDGDGNQGTAKQLQLFPSFRYQVNENSDITFSLEYNQQEITGNRGIRPFDASIVNEALNWSAFEAAYPGYLARNNLVQPKFYPNTGDYDEPKEGKTLDAYFAFNSQFNDQWEYSVSGYGGKSRESVNNISDFLVMYNPGLDPQSFAPEVLKEVYQATQHLSSHNVVYRQQFEDALYQLFPELNRNKTPFENFFEGGINYPYWTDGKTHFYQQVLVSKNSAHQFSLEFNLRGEKNWFGADHSVLIGSSISRLEQSDLTNLKFNRQLYGLSKLKLEEKDLFLAAALGRYALTTWFDPFGVEINNNIILPQSIAEIIGESPTRQYPLDDELKYLDNKISHQVAGFYFLDNVSFNEKWKLLLSMGYYHYDYHHKIYEINFLSFSTGILLPIENTINAEENVFVPQIGLTYLPIENLSFYTSYGKQFNMVDGLAYDGSVFSPEMTSSIEAGTKWWILPQLNFSMAVFQLTKENWTIAGKDLPDYLSQGGHLRSQGVELNLTGFITPHYKIATNYGKHSLKALDGGARPENFLNYVKRGVPDISSSLWLQYLIEPFGKSGWTYGLGVSQVSKREIARIFVTEPLDGYSIFDAAISYHHQDFMLVFTIDNLTDKKWLSGLSANPVIGDNSYYYSIGYGRRGRLALELYF